MQSSVVVLMLLSLSSCWSYHGPAAVSYFQPDVQVRRTTPLSKGWYSVIKTLLGTPALFRMGRELERQAVEDNNVAKRSWKRSKGDNQQLFRPAYGFGKRSDIPPTPTYEVLDYDAEERPISWGWEWLYG